MAGWRRPSGGAWRSVIRGLFASRRGTGARQRRYRRAESGSIPREPACSTYCGRCRPTSKSCRPRKSWASPWAECGYAGWGRSGHPHRGDLALRSIDEIPALAVACAVASGRSEFSDLGELRVKESDRIASIARELRRAGVEIEQTSDGFAVVGSDGLPPKGGHVLPDRDHRIAMAGAVLGLLSNEKLSCPARTSPRRSPPSAILQALGGSVRRDVEPAG